MPNSFDEIIKENLNHDNKLPESVRNAFDNSYEIIQTKSNRKRKKWVKPVLSVAASLVLITSLTLTNDQVMAKIQNLLGVGDQGIKIARENNDVNSDQLSYTSNNIEITLEEQFIDAYRLGVLFEIDSEEIPEGVTYADFEYRILDSDGKELSAQVSDSKTMSGKPILSGASFKTTYTTDEKLSIEMITQSLEEKLPNLINSQLVIETIHLVDKDHHFTSIEGKWIFDLEPSTIKTKKYIATNEIEGLILNSATITNGSILIDFTLDKKVEDENKIFNIELGTNEGFSTKADTAVINRLPKGTQISLVFPLRTEFRGADYGGF